MMTATRKMGTKRPERFTAKIQARIEAGLDKLGVDKPFGMDTKLSSVTEQFDVSTCEYRYEMSMTVTFSDESVETVHGEVVFGDEKQPDRTTKLKL